MRQITTISADPSGIGPMGSRAFRVLVMTQTWDLIANLVRQAIERHRQRVATNQLRSLNDKALKDIGIHRSGILSIVYADDSEEPRHARR